MNHKFVNTTAKAISIIATSALLIAGNPSNTYAGTGKGKEITKMSDEQVSVKYVGTSDNSYVFHIQFENPANQKSSVIVKNDAGIIVYSEQFTGAHFSKNFRLPNEGGEMHPTFVVRTGNQEVARSFSVNTRLTESVEVTKL